MHWRIAPGASAVPWVHKAGFVAWLMAAGMAFTWWLALCLDTLAGQFEPLGLLLASALTLAWLILALRGVLRCLHKPASLTLVWRGPVKRRAAAKEEGGRLITHTGDAESGGFAVVQWRAPVTVRRLVEWEDVVLLQVSSLAAGKRPRVAYCWLHASQYPLQSGHEGRVPAGSFHALQTLLRLPPSMTCRQPAQALLQPKRGRSGRQVTSPMASWRMLSKHGARGHADLTSPHVAQARQASAADSAASLFPATVQLPFSEPGGRIEFRPGASA